MPELPGAQLIQAFVSLIVTLVIMAVLMFGFAGTLTWAQGWWFMATFVVLILISMAWLWRVNPEIFVARSRLTGEGTKGWDRVLVPLLLLAYMAIFPVAALDGARFRRAPAADWLVLLGYLLLVVSFGGVAWAQAVNRHFEPSVRIQSERSHTVITTGPYAYVRHPGYVFGSLLAVAVALALGSLWALVPALLVTALALIRTNLEDATLQRELQGYAEFAQTTRFKWVPGVW